MGPVAGVGIVFGGLLLGLKALGDRRRAYAGKLRRRRRARPVPIRTRRTPKATLGVAFRNPVPHAAAIVSSAWGDPRPHIRSIHYGIDIRAPKGADVVAALAGDVIKVDPTNTTTAGRHVIVRSSLPGGVILTLRYLHLDKVTATNGARVAAGEKLGTVGRTYGPGGGSSPAHLHFDMFGNALAIGLYREAYGTPQGGFPGERFTYGRQFPAEPFIPVPYSAIARKKSIARGIPVRKEPVA